MAQLLHKKPLSYRVMKLMDFDIFMNKSCWPMLCILVGSDNGTGHAVTVCGDLIFDSNLEYALTLTQENLNWCCGADGVNVKFVKVYRGYRFEKTGKVPKHFDLH